MLQPRHLDRSGSQIQRSKKLGHWNRMATRAPASTRMPATASSGLASRQTAHVSVKAVRMVTATGELATRSSSRTASFSSHHKSSKRRGSRKGSLRTRTVATGTRRPTNEVLTLSLIHI